MTRHSTLTALEGIALAPIRDLAAVRAADARDVPYAALTPWDPWPETRVGYGLPSDFRFSSPLFPPPRAMAALARYLRQYGAIV